MDEMNKIAASALTRATELSEKNPPKLEEGQKWGGAAVERPWLDYKIEEVDFRNLDNVFTYHAPKADQPPRYETLRSFAKRFALEILSDCPKSRERSLALTKLEEVVFWANAAIARNE